MMKKILIALTFITCTAQASQPPKTVRQVDLKKYMGTWYEIASFPTFFQRGCQCTTAHYTIKKNKVQILNRCRKGKKK